MRRAWKGLGGHREDIHVRSQPELVLHAPQPPSWPEEIFSLEN